MNVTKDLLEYCKIISFSVLYNNKEIMTFLKKYEKLFWVLSLSEKVVFQKNDILKIKINLKETEPIFFETKCLEIGLDYCIVKSPQNENQNEPLNKIIKTFSILEYQDEKFGRRKEKRIEIGKSLAQKFGLKNLEQFVYFQKQTKPCAIVDVSLHGVCILMPYFFSLQKIENFIIKLDFIEPQQTVILKAHKVHIRLIKAGEKTFALVSCQLLEPIHFEWKRRVVKMLE